jgi:uncharacterized protein (TIGR00251 family)
MRIAVRAHPGASRERAQWDGDVLHVWVTARAVEGRANVALVKAVARVFGVRASSVTLVSGEHGRDKVLAVDAPNEGPPDPTSGSRGRS